MDSSIDNGVLLSQVYNIATNVEQSTDGLDKIKKLIEKYREQVTMSARSVKTSSPLPPLSFSTLGDDDLGIKGNRNGNGNVNGNRISSRSGNDEENAKVHTQETWVEFSLEEELEGICDAPVEEQEAMRKAMKEREKVRRLQLLESAARKRRLAEQEGFRLQKEFREKTETPISSPGNRTRTTPTLSSGRSSVSPSMDQPKTPIPPRVARLLAVPRKPSPFMDSGDDDDESDTPKIISLSTTPTKNMSRFGVEFTPRNQGNRGDHGDQGLDSTEATFHRRTILIQNIPPSFNVHKVLSYISGGMIVSVKLIPESASLGRGQTAIIVFTNGADAASCVRTLKTYSTKKAGAFAGCHGFQVSLLPLPTYPTQESLVFDKDEAEFSLELQKQTRCILINDFPRQHLHDLCIELHLNIRHHPQQVQALEEMWYEGRTLHINYTSIRDAVRAFKTVKYFFFGKFSLQSRFGVDPCALPASDDVKVASHGYIGLKSLIETVGLAVYSRNHWDSVPTTTASHPHVKPKLSSDSSDASSSSNSGYNTAPESPDYVDEDSSSNSSFVKGSDSLISTPWTESMMQGLHFF